MCEVGAFDAKNRLGQLLDLVERGEEIIITRRGRTVARLVPPRQAFNREEARAALRRIRERAEKLKLGPFEWAEWKSFRDEGRPRAWCSTVRRPLLGSSRTGPRRRNCRGRGRAGFGALAPRSGQQPDGRGSPVSDRPAFRNAVLADLALLDFTTDPYADAYGWTTTMHFADRFQLSIYDAAYLELAHRRSPPLASLDEELRAAGRALGVPLLGAAA